jgi:HEPN domain-containing protein
MDEATLSLAREWCAKAASDLASARKLAAEPDPILDTAIYHCQQAAEKAVKAFLVLAEQRFEKTHDVRLLVDEASVLEPRFNQLLPEGELLTPYATEFRYPDAPAGPTAEEFAEALRAAENVLQFVLGLHPQLVPDKA